MSTIHDWERERGVMFFGLSVEDTKKIITESEFNSMISTNSFTGVNWNDRLKFLKENGYELTRDNVVDGSLSRTVKSE